MVLASICERASTEFYFVSTSSDHICLASSVHFRNNNPFSISYVVLVTSYSYKKWNKISFVPPVQYLERKKLTYHDLQNFD